MKISGLFSAATIVLALSLGMSGCQLSGQEVFNESFLTSVTGDEEPTDLTLKVRRALKNNAQTAIYNIKVLLLSEGSIKLSGYVPDSATLHEAERVAYGIEGVRIVANGLNIQ